MLENGKKVLNTHQVNYSYNSLHTIFREAFKKSNFQVSSHSRVLMLGLGGGSIIRIIRDEYRSAAAITAIEIDPIIIEIARSDFNIQKYEPLRIICTDAFTYIKNVKDTYHVICVDLFIHDEVPPQFLSVEFISGLISALEPGGKIYFNFMDCSADLTLRFDHMLNKLSDIALTSITKLSFKESNLVLVITK